MTDFTSALLKRPPVRTFWSSFLIASALVATSACGGDGATPSVVDSGTSVDSGAGVDSGTQTGTDSGRGVDSGPGVDSGVRMDSGPGVDSGPHPDSGPTSVDTGPTGTDSGPLDVGPADVGPMNPFVGHWTITTIAPGTCGAAYAASADGMDSPSPAPGEIDFQLALMGNTAYPSNFLGCTYPVGMMFTCTMGTQQGYVPHGGCAVGLAPQSINGTISSAPGAAVTTGTLAIVVQGRAAAGCMQYNCDSTLLATFSVARM